MSSLAPALAGCAGTAGEAPRTDGPGRAALLVPLEGRAAELGQIMALAASLGGGTPGFDPEIAVIDTGGTPESAAAAAVRAREGGARIVLGPLFGDQARAVADAASNLPVVTFSNDAKLAARDLFVFGVTPDQSAQAALGFAAGRGMGRIGLVVPEGPFGTRTEAAVREVAKVLGLALLAPLTAPEPAAAVARMQAAAGGLPDAVYLPAANASLAPLAGAFRAAGVQVLGSAQWLGVDAAGTPALEGAWFAAPDPSRYGPFTEAFSARSEASPGLIAGLAFDAAEAARILGRIGQQNRAGLLRDRGFDGVLGPFRFLEDGRVARGLAVLGVEAGALKLLGATGV
ncbi:penicillin-binding protein activator [Jannaschia sp. W003]|uniref:penicillin-binding protein activator n=1 Tax=Jannaschia sp. W003 TaxID=2867012 RepID=UPI0021A5A36E|nr:penicillin-binding protein activator [Jannaschia sp. W003]UWQ23167.1 penicillin-binding protein activator [Jannaschia sp. W003]